MRGGAIPQHFHPLEGDGGDGGDIRPVGAIRHAVAEEGNDRRPVPALAVHEDEGGIRRQAPQPRGPHEGGRVVDGLLIDDVGGDEGG